MSTANTSQISLNARASRIGRTLALFFVSYSSAAILLGVVDTLVMVGRFGPTCDLSVPEIVGLPLLALKMPWALHLVLVLGGSLFLGIVELLPLRRTVRTAVLSLPLAAALAAGFFGSPIVPVGVAA